MISYELDPKAPKAEQVVISRDGQIVERCALTDRAARLQALGYRAPTAPRRGWTATGQRVSSKYVNLSQRGR